MFALLILKSASQARDWAEALSLNGFDCEICLTGIEATSALRGGGADLCVIDLHFEGNLGCDLADSARALNPLAPVMLLTQTARHQGSLHPAADGPDGYSLLPAPVTRGAIDLLAMAIGRSTRRRLAHHEAAAIAR